MQKEAMVENRREKKLVESSEHPKHVNLKMQTNLNSLHSDTQAALQ